jgi:hypothetical protein
MKMNLSQLKKHDAKAEPHFFDSQTMRFFGDTMSNYGVRARTRIVQSHAGPVECYVLYRKKPVRSEMGSFRVPGIGKVATTQDGQVTTKEDTFFSVETGERISPLES